MAKTAISRFMVVIERTPDQDPDLSWLGTYTDKPTFPFYDRREGVVVHNSEEWEALGERRKGREYLYIHDFQCPEDDKAIEQDARRLEDYGNGWSMECMTATATLDGHEWGSASLGGIESDSDDAYFLEVEQELTDEARAMADVELDRFLATHCQHEGE